MTRMNGGASCLAAFARRGNHRTFRYTTGRSLLALFLPLLVHLFAQVSSGQTPARNSKDKHGILHLDGGPPLFKTWLEQDVVWIITPEEKTAFKLLQKDEQRDEFIEAFWQRRDPTPDTYENEFKDEHYRRMVYANEHFATRDPGWKTDRGRIYVVYGQPDRITTYSGNDIHPQAQDGQSYTGLPFETWSYRYLEGVGIDVVIDFVDICSCGDYRMKMHDEARDALLFIPDVGVDEKKLKSVPPEFYLRGDISPAVKFHDLEALLNSHSKMRAIPFEVNTIVTMATDVSSILQITIRFKDAEMASPGAQPSPAPKVQILGRLTTLTGHLAGLFEETVDLSKPSGSQIQKNIGLFEGHYRLEIAAETTDIHKTSIWTSALNIKPIALRNRPH